MKTIAEGLAAIREHMVDHEYASFRLAQVLRTVERRAAGAGVIDADLLACETEVRRCVRTLRRSVDVTSSAYWNRRFKKCLADAVLALLVSARDSDVPVAVRGHLLESHVAHRMQRFTGQVRQKNQYNRAQWSAQVKNFEQKFRALAQRSR